MALTKEDLSAIEKIIKNELNISEEKIVSKINREIIDLADFNRAVLNRLENHERRLIRIEKELTLEAR